MGKKKDSSEDKEETPSQDTLQVPGQKVRKVKSPTPGSMRDRSATPLRRSQTPIRGRSQTPVAIYMARRSATPSGWRSISPFLKRDEKEKTPFELGRDMKMQTICNMAVLDKALVMDISEPEDIQKPVRYITSDLSIIDRAAVMDVSNVEVIYVVEEYDEYEDTEEEVVEDVKPKRKSSRDKRRKSRKSVDLESTPELGFDDDDSREESVEGEDLEEGGKKGKKKSKRKDKKEKSPSPMLTLNLEIGGGQKAAKKMFEEGSKPPAKKTKKAILEEKARAAKAAEEEKQRRLKEEKEAKERKEAEMRAKREAEEAAAAAAAEAAAAAAAAELEAAEAAALEEENWDEDAELNEEDANENLDRHEEEIVEEHPEEEQKKARRGSTSSEEYVRPDPEEEERWTRVAKDDIDDITNFIGRYTHPEKLSEKDRDKDWKDHIEKNRLPRFVIFLADQSASVGHKVRLTCAYDGPGVSIRWYKDNCLLERGDKYTISNVNCSLGLLINDTTIADTGVYKCVIANMNGETASSCIVTFYEDFKTLPSPPSFRLVREYYHMRDDELTIECHVLGVPRPRVTWYWEGMDITVSYKHTLLEEEDGICKLVIFKPSWRDSGKYTCLAENPSGEAKITHIVEVASDLHYPLPGVFHARDVIQQEKERATRKIIAAALQSKAESDRRLSRVRGLAYNGPLVASQRSEGTEYGSTLAEYEAETEGQEEKRSRMPDASAKDNLYFIAHLANRFVSEGSKVQLQAIVGGPNAQVHWQKDDKAIEFDPRVQHKSSAGVEKLIISEATVADSGKYTLIAENEASKVTSTAYLQVYQPTMNADVEPVFSRPIKETFHSHHNEIELETTVRGYPTPDVWWYRDGADMLNGGRLRVQQLEDGTCRLTIDSPTTRDSGKILVVAQNRAGKTTLTHDMILEPSMYPTPSIKHTEEKRSEQQEETHYERRNRLPDIALKDRLYFISGLTNRYVADGGKITLQVVVGGPKPKITWQKDDDDLVFGPHIHHKDVEGVAKIIITNVGPADAGKYTVIAQNEYTKIATTGMLHVYQTTTNAWVQPVFSRPIKEFYDFTVNELVLETCVRGNPKPNVSWYVDGMDILNTYRSHVYELEDGTIKASIYAPTAADSGRYMVVARNEVGEASISHRVLFEPKSPPKVAENEEVLLIKERTRRRLKKEIEESAQRESPHLPDVKQQVFFRNHLSNRTIQEGSSVKWLVTIDGPKPVATWYHNGKKIVSDEKCKFTNRNGMATLNVFNVTKDDAGEYQLRVKGPENEIVSTCQLFTYSLDEEEMIAPSFAMRIKDNYILEDKSLVLDCRVHGRPRPEMEWFKDGVEVEIGEKYLQVDEDDGYSKLVINNATKQDSGQYTCMARNAVSYTKMTHTLDFGGADLLYYEKTLGNFRRDPRKPHFLYQLGNQTIAVGGCAVICAEFLPMNELFDVHWLLDHEPLAQDTDTKMFFDKGVYILILMEASVATQGTYTCRASTLLHGYTDSNAHVDVAVAVPKEERPPLFTVRPYSKVNIAVGEPFTISCAIEKISTLKLTVFHGTKEITQSNRVTKEIDEDKLEYTIQTTTLDDTGFYFIVARNVFGTDRVFVNVTMNTEEPAK